MKLAGFLKSFAFSPGPLVPVFSAGDGSFAVQVIEEGKVAEFLPLPTLPSERFILMGEKSYPEVDLGESAVLAFDRGEGDIALRRPEKYSTMLGEFLADRWKAISPFSALELALMINDEAMIRQMVPRCVEFLGGGNSNVAKKWLAGSGVPDVVKRFAQSNEVAEEDSAAIAPDDRLWYVMFSGPKFLVKGLTEICRARLHAPRTSVVRDVLSEEYDEPLSSGHVEDTLGILLDRVEQATNAERLLIRLGASSGGRVSMPIGWNPKVADQRFQQFQELMDRSPSVREIQRHGIDLQHVRVRMTIYIWHQIMLTTNESYLRDINITSFYTEVEMRTINAIQRERRLIQFE